MGPGELHGHDPGGKAPFNEDRPLAGGNRTVTGKNGCNFAPVLFCRSPIRCPTIDPTHLVRQSSVSDLLSILTADPLTFVLSSIVAMMMLKMAGSMAKWILIAGALFVGYMVFLAP